MQLPEIRMEYGYFLDNAFKQYLAEIPKEYEIDSADKVLKKIPLYEAEWKKYEQKVVGAMCDILGLEFYKKVLDVYIVGAWKNAFSTPLVMSSKYKPELFVDILTHELLHVLLTDNTKQVKVVEVWGKMFPEATDRTSRYHVLVHAVHKEIFLKVMDAPERLKRDIERCKPWKGYVESWGIVEKRGHMNIINEFKSYYAKNKTTPQKRRQA